MIANEKYQSEKNDHVKLRRVFVTSHDTITHTLGFITMLWNISLYYMEESIHV